MKRRQRYHVAAPYGSMSRPTPDLARPILPQSLEPDRTQAAWVAEATALCVAVFAGAAGIAQQLPWYAVLLWLAGAGIGSGSIVFLIVSWVFVLLRVRRWVQGEPRLDEPPTIHVPPEQVRLEIVDTGSGQITYAELPIPDEKLTRLAVACLHNGRPFSRPGLRGILSQGEYNRLAPVMVRRGLARRLGNRRELTERGKRVLRRYLQR